MVVLEYCMCRFGCQYLTIYDIRWRVVFAIHSQDAKIGMLLPNRASTGWSIEFGGIQITGLLAL
ncbi:MAG: hypothetical protein DSY88_10830 [Candidatus Poseidoniales archaeon]|nr:MAG: hypothetical protein DSY88_10830 [Candidatus Poseidoniales archaeon]